MAKLSSDNIAKFKPQTRNGNKHTQRGMGMLESSMRQYGYVSPMTAAADGEIIDGSARIETSANVFGDDAIVVHHDGTKPIIMVRDDIASADTPEARAISMAANRISQVNLDFDAEVILGDLQAGVDLEQFWRKDELDELLADLQPKTTGDTPAEVDRAEELRAKWNTAPGQLWQLGEHRLVCGDCTDPATVARVMGGERAQAVFTDPPYGINYDPQFLAEIAERHNKRLSSNRTIAGDDGTLDVSFLWQYERRMIWGFPYIYDPDATGWIVWDKQPGVESRGIVTPIEMASTTMRKGFDMVRVMWGGFYRAAGEDKQPHPTQKPLGVYRPFIEQWTKEGDVIFDPFSGSAPVLMVCEELGRKCRAIEIDAGFTAVALERWSVHTGRQPVLVEGAPVVQDVTGDGRA